MSRIKAIVIGAGGYWGQKIISNLENIPDVEITGVCDINPKALDKYRNKHQCFTNLDILSKVESDVSFIITRANTHFELVKESLLKGNHVFVEKPMTLDANTSSELIELARTTNRVLSVDHTFLFTPEVKFFKDYITNDIDIKSIELKRTNNGPFSKDINVIEDLCPHDFSILNYIIPYNIEGISANGVSVINNVIERANITIHYKNTDFKAFVYVSWLEQNKSREIKLIESNGRETQNDSAVDNLIRTFFFNNNIHIGPAPLDNSIQSLYSELLYFIDCIKHNRINNIIDGQHGLQVVKMINAANRSIKLNGHMIYV